MRRSFYTINEINLILVVTIKLISQSLKFTNRPFFSSRSLGKGIGTKRSQRLVTVVTLVPFISAHCS